MIRFPVGVIFIDCWDANSSLTWLNKGGLHNDFYLNILDTLSAYNVSNYVFHTSFLSLDYVTQDVVNYFKEFLATDDVTQDRRQAFADYLNFTGYERLSRHLNTLAGNEKSIFIPSFNGFKQWCQIKDVSRWIVVGGHWPICTHEKPLGFDNLLEYKQQTPHMEFYSIPSCTMKWHQNSVDNNNAEQICTVCEDQDYQEDSKSWTKINNNLYQLTL